ncbi:MAG: DUF1553 domain-containing protein [Pirellulales bacterium]
MLPFLRRQTNYLVLAHCALVGWAWFAPPVTAASFDVEIAPLLARRCLECHNPADTKGGLDLTSAEGALAGGDSGPALVQGNLEESYLWERIEQDEMPPKHPLSPAEKELLRQWIAAGGEWGKAPIDRFRYTSDARAGYDWWALRPLSRPAPPEQAVPTGWEQPIDRFILARLSAAGLSPSPQADRRTLIRRLSFDLTGLPPSPEEVSAFENDADPAAYENLVDRLLASPAYGERWGRHWLDLARFGESHGFEYDEPRRNAWPYRDWVIEAFNRDLPYDEFARQQIAGDVLQPDDPAAITATGFLVAGPYDTPGQNQQSAAMKAVVRQDELEDLVAAVGQTFLGLTVNCARCHDHKFDPIRQQEYYRLTAALGGVRHGERDVTPAAELAEHARGVASVQTRLEASRAELAAIEEPVKSALLNERESKPADLPAPIARWDFDHDLQDQIGELHATAQGGASLEKGSLRVDSRAAYAATGPLKRDLRAKTLAAWVRLDDLNQRGGAAIGVQTPDGRLFDALVFGEREPGHWMAGSEGFARTQPFGGEPETEAVRRVVHVAIVYGEDGAITCYRNGRSYGQPYQSGLATFPAGQAQVVFGLRHAPVGEGKLLAAAIEQAELYDRALSPEEVAASAHFVSEEALVERLSLAQRARRTELQSQIVALQAQLASPPQRMTYACAPRQPEPAHVLLRGDTRTPGDVVSAGALAAVAGPTSDFGLTPDAPEGQGRAALARWITNAENPLFARVIVNRLWHHHFGGGIVDTPNDFGFNGGRPSHPELLDWLAAELIEGGWRLKALHRLIVTSAAYQQVSLPRADAAPVDAGNRLLWRAPLRRLEAEAVRDAALGVAGQLNPQRGGPGYLDYQEVNRAGSWSYLPTDSTDESALRRSVYRTWARGGRSGLLDTFDCPDPSTISPRRAVTTTPLQALALLNNAFMLRMAEHFAARLEQERPRDRAAQLERAYRLSYGRPPSADELAAAEQVASEHGLEAFTRALLNSNEFLYVE